jgi:hypothetical protein
MARSHLDPPSDGTPPTRWSDHERGQLLPELPSTESGYWRWLVDMELVEDLDVDL